MSLLNPSILDLAGKIQASSQVIHDHLQQNSLPPLSFSSDGFPFFPGTGPKGIDPFPKPSSNILNARRELRQACETLLQLIVAPADHLIWNLSALHHQSACLHYVYHYRIAEAVPIQGEISFADLATKAGVDEGQCTRILRMLMTNNYFHEPKPGYVGHTAGSNLLQLPNVRDTVGYLIDEGFQGASRLVDATNKFHGSQERNESSWNVAHGVQLPIFDFFETDPIRMKRFVGCMDNFGSQEAYNVQHLADALGDGTVVDVGGSLGHSSFAVAKVAPSLRFIVQDLEKVIEGVRVRMEDQKNEMVDFEAHDFFEPQTIKNADVYLLRFICHDYSDKYAVKILDNLVPAMGPKSQIIIFDGVMPAPDVVSKAKERIMRQDPRPYWIRIKKADEVCVSRTTDIEMMLQFNAVERDLEGWKALFAKADKRLKLHQVVTPPGSAQSILELVLDDT